MAMYDEGECKNMFEFVQKVSISMRVQLVCPSSWKVGALTFLDYITVLNGCVAETHSSTRSYENVPPPNRHNVPQGRCEGSGSSQELSSVLRLY